MRIRLRDRHPLHADHVSAGTGARRSGGRRLRAVRGRRSGLSFRGVRDGECSSSAMSRRSAAHARATRRSTSRCWSPTERARTSPGCVDRPHADGGRSRAHRTCLSAEEGARDLFRSAQRLKELARYLEVLPGAYSGSVCGRGLSGKPSSTIGFEKRHNKAFRIEDEEEFVRFMLADIPPAPPRPRPDARRSTPGQLAAA